MNSSFAVFRPPIRLACVCLCWWATQVSAADADPGKPANIDLRNPGFEGATSIQDNLWDGVASDGTLAGFNYSAEVVLESGRFGRLAMPPSIAYVDLNGDGVPDLFTADPTGYFRFYPNLGTAAAPRFTQAEILPIYLSMVSSVRANTVTREIGENSRNCPRFSLADWRHGGLLDLLIGNYLGEILFVPNMGTTRQPVFRQPSMPGGIAGARLMTSDKARLWGNLLSPAAIDLKNNGQPDLLLGEGTYSANSIHRLRNLSGGGMPKFNDAERSYIAYGDGREQLIPTAVDYDGDGNADLLVADRTGEVGVYLNPGDAKTPGEAFKRVSTLTFGSTSKLPGLCSLYAADFNGDGLFDLLLGMPNGRIAVALNTGSKGSPKFGPPQNLKGEERLGRNVILPESWQINCYPEHGNALAYLSVVDAKSDPAAQLSEGQHCLKAGYWPQAGEIFRIPPEGIPGMAKHFQCAQVNVKLKNNQSYELSFRVKATGMEKMAYRFYSHYRGSPTSGKIVRGERGEVVSRVGFIDEVLELGDDFKAGPNWGAAGGKLEVRYKHNELRNEPEIIGTLYVEFWATNLSSAAYFDDFKLMSK